MSEITFGEIEDVAEDSLNRASLLLAGVPGGIYRAVGSALKRGAQRGRTVGMKIVAEEYAIGQNELKARTRTTNTIIKDQYGQFSVTFGYRGNVISLMKFDTVVNRNGLVSSRVLRSGSREALDHAFVAQMGGHRGVFERESSERFPVRELFGPAAPQAFYAREETTDKMNDTILASFNDRIEHEITRVLNGW